MPSQIAHRAALPDLRLSEQLGIVVSSWLHRSCSWIILFSRSHFMRSCAFQRMQPRTTTISNSIECRYSSRHLNGVADRYEGLGRLLLKPATSAKGGSRVDLPQIRHFRATPGDGHIAALPQLARRGYNGHTGVRKNGSTTLSRKGRETTARPVSVCILCGSCVDKSNCLHCLAHARVCEGSSRKARR